MSPAPISLAAGEVHVWHTELTTGETVLTDARRMLSDDERERASRFRLPGLENTFTAAHAFLRQVLGAYLAVEPADVRFRYTVLGKPELADCSDLGFNLSHSGHLGAIAVARRRAVGIDIEIFRDNLDVMDLARRFFAPGEWKRIEALPLEQRPPLFFTLWTCKEAYLKARGIGLTGALDDFEVSPSNETDCVEFRSLSAGDIGIWTLRRLHLDSRAAAAVAVEGCGLRIRCAPWSPNPMAPTTLAAGRL